MINDPKQPYGELEWQVTDEMIVNVSRVIDMIDQIAPTFLRPIINHCIPIQPVNGKRAVIRANGARFCLSMIVLL